MGHYLGRESAEGQAWAQEQAWEPAQRWVLMWEVEWVRARASWALALGSVVVPDRTSYRRIGHNSLGSLHTSHQSIRRYRCHTHPMKMLLCPVAVRFVEQPPAKRPAQSAKPSRPRSASRQKV